jgi:hypothetical protein
MSHCKGPGLEIVAQGYRGVCGKPAAFDCACRCYAEKL